MTVAVAANTGINFVAPDGGWGWVIVISSLFIHVIMDGLTYSLGQFLDIFVEDFNVSYGTVSVIHGLLPAVTLSCGPIGSSLSNRFGCRITTIIGALIAVVGFVLTILVHNIYFLYFSIGIVTGIGYGMVYVPAIVTVGYYFEKKRTIAMGIAVCGSGLGTFIFPSINRLLLDKYGWQGTFLVQAGFVLNIVVCAMVMRPLSIEPSEILKRKRKLQKSIKDKTEESMHDPEKQSFLKNQTENTIAKIAESMPSILINNSNTDKVDGKSSNGATLVNKHLDVAAQADNANLFFKSLPQLVENDDKLACEFEDALLRSYSTLNVLAHMRSNKNINDPKFEIHGSTNKIKNLNETKQIIVANISSNYDLHSASVNNTVAFVDEPTDEHKTIDLKILCNFVYLFFAISNFLTSLGFNAPYIFITDQAKSYGISETNADFVLQMIGISNTIGRVVLGFLCNFEWVNRVHLYGLVITICGLATIAEPFLRTFPLMILYSSVFGFTSGGYVSMTSILLTDLFGLENLSNSFGILLIFQGVATAIGPPAAGFMRDAFNSYNMPFIFLGTAIAISGLMCFFIPCLLNFTNNKKKKKENGVYMLNNSSH